MLRLDLAVLLVARPCWGRMNRYDQAPDTAPYQALTQTILIFGYFSRLRRPARRALTDDAHA